MCVCVKEEEGMLELRKKLVHYPKMHGIHIKLNCAHVQCQSDTNILTPAHVQCQSDTNILTPALRRPDRLTLLANKNSPLEKKPWKLYNYIGEQMRQRMWKLGEPTGGETLELT